MFRKLWQWWQERSASTTPNPSTESEDRLADQILGNEKDLPDPIISPPAPPVVQKIASPIPPRPQSVAEQTAHLHKLLEQGKKIEAVRTYRHWAGVSLQQAKADIDQMQAELKSQEEAVHQQIIQLVQAGKRNDAAMLYIQATSVTMHEALEAISTIVAKQNIAPSQPVPFEQLSKEVAEQLHGLLDGGRKIEAIKLYRLHTGVSLRDAKKVIEQIHDQRHGR